MAAGSRDGITRLRAVLATAVLAFSACADGDGGDTSARDTTTTEAPSATTSSTLPGGALVRCESPEGFTVDMPEDWVTNEGDVVPTCSRFNPEPFEVEAGTDAREAAISAYIDPLAFSTAAAPGDTRDEDRAVTVVQGRQAVRLSYETDGEGLFPAGTPITSYLVDVQPELGDPATLFLNTVGLGDFDYETNVTVLDRMFRTLDIGGLGVEVDPNAIAAYRGGATGFTVVATAEAGQVCLRIPPRGEEVCTDEPESDQVHTVLLADLDADVHSGVTGVGVWRVDLVTPDGDRHSYLPASVMEAEVRAYAFADTIDGFERLVLYDLTGDELRTVRPGSA